MDDDELPEDDPQYERDLFGTFVLLAVGALILIGVLFYRFLL